MSEEKKQLTKEEQAAIECAEVCAIVAICGAFR